MIYKVLQNDIVFLVKLNCKRVKYDMHESS